MSGYSFRPAATRKSTRALTRALSTMALAAAVGGALACGPQGLAPVTTAEFTLQQAADSIPLTVGKDVKVGDAWVTFTSVSTDSRCPTGVQCVWEGDAVVELAVHPPCFPQGCKAASQRLSLHTRLEPRSGDGWGHRFTLLALHPYPVEGMATDTSRYVAWVRVTQ